MRNVLILGCFLALLGACGSKGPLTLPPPPAKPAATAPTSAIDNSTAPAAPR